MKKYIFFAAVILGCIVLQSRGQQVTPRPPVVPPQTPNPQLIVLSRILQEIQTLNWLIRSAFREKIPNIGMQQPQLSYLPILSSMPGSGPGQFPPPGGLPPLPGYPGQNFNTNALNGGAGFAGGRPAG